MNTSVEKIQTTREGHPTAIDYEFSMKKIEETPFDATTKNERLADKITAENEVLRVCQALLLLTCVLVLSYYSVRYGQTEYSILESGQIVKGYKQKAVVTLSLGYSVPYSLISFLTTGMLAYSLVSKRPRWSLPSLILYSTDLVYDVSAAIVVVWLFVSNCSLPTALSYATGSALLIRTFHFFKFIWNRVGIKLKLIKKN
ncbi:uncharacterized protein LOC143343306 [Colletes latitarsis]|uniref:uncharacterized protein LOC143343306 n=1 Tax=Colletes latitarsis TaxID=2605962 RepID=UPI00403707FC